MKHPRSAAPPAAGALLAMIALAGGAYAQERPPVALATAERAPIVQEIGLSGSLNSPRRARIAPELAGRVSEIAVETGDRVARGDRLLALDAELGRIELRRTEAARAETEATLADARRRLREAEELAQRDSIARTELEGRQYEVQRLEAVLARRKAERDHQAALLRRHVLAAPFAGVINRRLIDLGERATPDETAFELVATDPLWLDLQVPQQHFGTVTTGIPARIRVDARPAEPLDGTIATVAPVSDDNSRTFLARIDVDNDAGHLIPGMSAQATLRVDTGRRGVTIPRDGLLRYPDGRTVVWIAEGDGERRTVRERRIHIGLQFGDRIEVRAGLEAGTAIVVEGNEALQDGREVRVTATDRE